MSHSLAGTNGIPLEHERIYVGVKSSTDQAGNFLIKEIHWFGPPARDFKVVTCSERRRIGRKERHNLVRSWTVTIGKYRQERVVFWEAGRWFVKKRPPRGRSIWD